MLPAIRIQNDSDLSRLELLASPSSGGITQAIPEGRRSRAILPDESQERKSKRPQLGPYAPPVDMALDNANIAFIILVASKG